MLEKGKAFKGPALIIVLWVSKQLCVKYFFAYNFTYYTRILRGGSILYQINHNHAGNYAHITRVETNSLLGLFLYSINHIQC